MRIAVFRTLKYTPAYPDRPFESLEAARHWVNDFTQWYNTAHRHSGLKFVTPNDRHNGKDKHILDKRKATYEAAKAARPERWSGHARNWSPIESVWLNPSKQKTYSTAVDLESTWEKAA